MDEKPESEASPTNDDSSKDNEKKAFLHLPEAVKFSKHTLSLQPPLKKACRCFPLGRTTQLIGILLIGFGLWCAYLQYYFMTQNPRTTLENYLDILFLFGYLLSCITLIVGAYLYKRWFLAPWLVYILLPGLVYVSVKMMLYSEDERFAAYVIALGVVVIIVHGYFWTVVISLFIIIGKHSSWAQQNQFDTVQHQQHILHQKHLQQQQHHHHHHHRHTPQPGHHHPPPNIYHQQHSHLHPSQH